jgi:hypothetical protein
VSIDERTAELRRIQGELRVMRDELLTTRAELEARNAELLLRYAKLVLGASGHHATREQRRAARLAATESLGRLGLAVVILDGDERPVARNAIAERHWPLAVAGQVSRGGTYVPLRDAAGAPEGAAIVAHGGP